MAVNENHIEEELKSMDQRMSEIENKMTSIDAKLTQVVDAILGNALTKSGGFVKDLNDLQKKIKLMEEQLKQQEEFRKKFSWTIGLIVAFGGLLQYIFNLYSKVK